VDPNLGRFSEPGRQGAAVAPRQRECPEHDAMIIAMINRSAESVTGARVSPGRSSSATGVTAQAVSGSVLVLPTASSPFHWGFSFSRLTA
jgi:hypothetical protein